MQRIKIAGKGRLPVEYIGTIEEMRAFALNSEEAKTVGDRWKVENLDVAEIVGIFEWDGEAWNTADQTVIIKEGNVITPKDSVFGDSIVASRVAQITGNFYLGISEDGATVTGSGTVSLKGNPGYENLLAIESTPAGGTFARIEQNESMRYIPGFELGAFFTTIFKSPPTGDGKLEAGITDVGANGFFIGYRQVEGVQKFGFGRVKDNVVYFTPIEDFNYDKLDGNGPSGITLDPTKGNIWRIRFGYLGFASPILEYVTPQNKIILLNILNYPNENTETSVSSTSLSPYALADNGTTAENVEVQIGSLCVYLVDGNNVGVNDRDFSYAANGTLPSAAYARRMLLDFRNSGSFQGTLMPSAKTHKIGAILNYLSMTLDGQNKPVFLEIIAVPDADITPGTYVKVSTDSILEIAQDSVVNTYANSRVIFADTFKSNIADKIEPLLDKLKLKLRPGFHAVFALTSDTTQAIEWAFANAWSEEF